MPGWLFHMISSRQHREKAQRGSWSSVSTRITAEAGASQCFPGLPGPPLVRLRTEEDIAVPDPELALVATLLATPEWFTPYLDYKARGILPNDEFLSRQIFRCIKSFVIHKDELH